MQSLLCLLLFRYESFGMKFQNIKSIFLLLIITSIFSCRKGDLLEIVYAPNSYTVEGTQYLGPLPVPMDNPMTLEGVTLGQHLFYDPLLSSTKTMSCSSCHDPQKAFTDNLAVSTGVTEEEGTRSSMSLVNAAYYTKGLFWDGRAETLEKQAIEPVENKIELNHDWGQIEEDLRNHATYPTMFRQAFGIEDTEEVTRELAAKAISQFERILISGSSKFDLWKVGLGILSDEELYGFDTFFDVDPLVQDGECGHCHNNPLFSTNQYFDNGIQDATSYLDYQDVGLGDISEKKTDYGKMRAPTLRNIALTAPYMHDGRFETLEEVIEHYSSGGHASPNRDVLIYQLNLSDQQKEGLLAFLHALTDTSYLENPLVLNPFE